eukprot:CCRYP_009159-RA/>CCRYP_009159-RA protein AED:0.00 eAED:0.00 QI:200/1/1/1/1/1/2/400/339
MLPDSMTALPLPLPTLPDMSTTDAQVHPSTMDVTHEIDIPHDMDVKGEEEEEVVVPAIPATDEEEPTTEPIITDPAPSAHPKRKHRAKPLTPKQAVTKFWNRGIFIAYQDPTTSDGTNKDVKADGEPTGTSTSTTNNKPKYIARCKCNPVCKTSFAGWDAYAYNRHFSYKKHTKWEEMRHDLGWDESEAYRDFVHFIELTLDDSDVEDDEDDDDIHNPYEGGGDPRERSRAVKRARRNLDENTIDAIIRVEQKMRDPGGTALKSGFKPEERRRQELHYLNLWKEARAELRVMRQELAAETDEEVVEELKRDILGLKKRKEEFAKFLGIDCGEAPMESLG